MPVRYYSDSELFRVRDLIADEVREGVRSLQASYISRKYRLDPALVQRVLSDLALEGALDVRYRLLCSGPNQRFDPDRDFSDLKELPTSHISCTKCGDVYVPSEEDILVLFEPTESFLHSILQHR
jgi:uncharacterized Zn-finger protein